MQSQQVRVLVIEDHEPSTMILCHVLRSRGYGCIAVDNAGAALSAVAHIAPHFVVYEWNLCSGPAYGLAARLRAASTSPLRVIALSTLNEPAGFCDDESVDTYITKPFDANALDELLSAARLNRLVVPQNVAGRRADHVQEIRRTFEPVGHAATAYLQ